MAQFGFGLPLALLLVGAAPGLAASPQNASTLRLVDGLLQTPDDRLNIGDAALKLSTLRFPDANVQGEKELLDGIAGRVRALVGNSRDPDLRIRVINTVLFRELGFSYDLEAMDALVRNERPELRTLSHLLRTHRGNCSSLPVLWFAIAERLNYPVFMVSAPQHLFLRYDDGTYRSNIEATSGGGESTDAQLAQDLGVPEEGIRSGAYMRELSKRELLGVLVADAVAPWISTDTQTAIQALESAALIAPRSVEIHWQLSAAHERQAKRLGSSGSHQRALSHATVATKLGAAEPVKEGYWKDFLQKRTAEDASEARQPSVRPKTYDVVAWLERDSKVGRRTAIVWEVIGSRSNGPARVLATTTPQSPPQFQPSVSTSFDATASPAPASPTPVPPHCRSVLIAVEKPSGIGTMLVPADPSCSPDPSGTGSYPSRDVRTEGHL
jgi:hypothetical protein